MKNQSSPDSRKYNPAPKYLRELIQRAGITQAEAAEHAGVSHRTMRYYLAHNQTGRKAPYGVQYILERIAKTKEEEKAE